jgi:hypothetical protein
MKHRERRDDYPPSIQYEPGSVYEGPEGDEYPNDDPDDFELDQEPRFAKQNVPWIRAGCAGYDGHPSSFAGYKPHKWGYKYLNIGPCRERLRTDKQMVEDHKNHGFSFGLEERAYAMLWDYENNGQSSPILSYWLNYPEIQALIKDGDDAKLAEMVAQCFAQWLGTNCGGSFLHSAEALIKKEKERIKILVDPIKAKEEKDKEEKFQKTIDEQRLERANAFQKLQNEKLKLEERVKVLEQSLEKEVENELERRRRRHIDEMSKMVEEGVRSLDI